MLSPGPGRTVAVGTVKQTGGLGKVYQLFGQELNTIIEELSEALAA